MGKKFADRLARAGDEAFEIHLQPRRDARDQGHVGRDGLIDNGLHLLLPVLDAIGTVGGLAVAPQVKRHAMGHDAREPPGEDAVAVLQHRTPLQEDHLPADEVHLTAGKDVTQQHVPRGPHLAGQAFPGERDVFRTGGRPRSLGKIRRPAGPKHVALALGDALDVAAEVFVRTKGDALAILLVSADVSKTVLPPESRIGRGGEKTRE